MKQSHQKSTLLNEKFRKNETCNRHQFDQNVDGRSGSIFEWISHGITYNRRFVLVGTFTAGFFSMYFFALSQPPPEFAAEIARTTPATNAPARTPARVFTPKRYSYNFV